MEEEIERRCKQQPEVLPSTIAYIISRVPYEETLNFLFTAKGTSEFWYRVGMLPPSIACEVLQEDAKIPVNSKAFLNDSLTPCSYSLYEADCLENDESPVVLCAPMFITASNEIISEIAGELGLNVSADGIEIGDHRFQLEELSLMFESFASEGKPWLVSSHQPLRTLYTVIDSLIEESRIIGVEYPTRQKLLDFEISSTSEANDILHPSLPKVGVSISVSKDILEGLHTLMHKVLDRVLSDPPTPELPDVDESSTLRSHALSEQMSRPFGQRTALNFDENVIACRSGEIVGSCDRSPLVDLLFFDQSGIPYPYPNCETTTELVDSPPRALAFSVIKLYIAAELRKNEFEYTSKSVLDTMTDYVIEYVSKVIGHNVSLRINKKKSPDREGER